MITNTELATLTAAQQMRPKVEDHLLDRLRIWVEIVGEKPLLKGGRNRTATITYQDEQLFNPEIVNVHLTYRWDDHTHLGGWGQRGFTIPKGFLFDEDGTYEQKFRNYKALEAELHLPETR